MISGAFSTDCLGNVELQGTLNGNVLIMSTAASGPLVGSATSAHLHVEGLCTPWDYGDPMRLDLWR